MIKSKPDCGSISLKRYNALDDTKKKHEERAIKRRSTSLESAMVFAAITLRCFGKVVA